MVSRLIVSALITGATLQRGRCLISHLARLPKVRRSASVAGGKRGQRHCSGAPVEGGYIGTGFLDEVDVFSSEYECFPRKYMLLEFISPPGTSRKFCWQQNHAPPASGHLCLIPESDKKNTQKLQLGGMRNQAQTKHRIQHKTLLFFAGGCKQRATHIL